MAKRTTFVIDENISEVKSDKNKIRIPRPTNKLVDSYLNKWYANEAYIVQDKAIKKIFKSSPQNTDLSDVFIKATILNTFYNTQIFSILPVAQHILKIRNMDDRLQKGDESLIAEFKEVDLGGEKHLNLYSFATKYCHFHNNDAFPMYDSYLLDLLWIFMNNSDFDKFKNRKHTSYDKFKVHTSYEKFKELLLNFKKHYKLEQCFKDFHQLGQSSTKEFDMFLWQLGRDISKEKQIITLIRKLRKIVTSEYYGNANLQAYLDAIKKVESCLPQGERKKTVAEERLSSLSEVKSVTKIVKNLLMFFP